MLIACLAAAAGCVQQQCLLSVSARQRPRLRVPSVPPCRWEGITFDAKRGKLYTAMSAIRNGMESNAVKGKPESK
jgi:hypothetical protein